MKFKVITIERNKTGKYDWFGMELKPSKNYQYIGDKSNKYEYNNITDSKVISRNDLSLEVTYDISDYDQYVNDVIVIPELSFKFKVEGSNLLLYMDNDFSENYNIYINEYGELIINNKLL